MYPMTVVECSSFRQAQLYVIAFEAEGWPTIAATVRDSDEEFNIVLTYAPERAPTAFSCLVRVADSMPDGLNQTRAIAATRNPNGPGCVPAAQRDELRLKLLAAVHTAAGSDVVVVRTEPALDAEIKRQLTTTRVNHDPGDEHIDNSSAVATMEHTPVHNPEGGGWERRCFDNRGVVHNLRPDEYDNWKAAR